MGIPGSANPMLFGGAAAYQISQSLRFNSADSTNLTRNISTTGNRRTFTISFWFKSVANNSAGGFVTIDGNILSSGYLEFQINGSNKLVFRYSIGNARSTLAVFRDPSAWYHIVFAVDTTQATDTNRIRVYVNGTEYATSGDAYPSQNFDTNFNTAGVASQIGYNRNSSGNPENYLSGYIAEYNHIDGQQLTPSSFGETDTITGAWIPKKYSGSYGTNGFYLKFEGSGIGTDSSGNGNTWTANNFSTSGTGTDVMSDTPTNNYCTWNPINKGPNAGSYGSQLSDGNLVLAYNRTAGDFYATSTFGLPTTGKWYWEQRLTSTGSISAAMGIAELNWTWNVSPKVSYLSSGKIVTSPDSSSDAQTGLSTYTTGDVIGHAWDADAGTLQFYKNGTAVGNPQAPTTTSGITFAITFNAGSDTGWTTVLNCGQRAFEQTPPTGFKALSTGNLPEPTIKKGSTYFDAVTYSGATSGTAGAGTTQAVTGLGFSPDLVWIKNRSNANSHGLFDQVRGAVNALRSDLTNAEATTNSSGALSAFNSNGFTLANGSSGSDQAILTHQSGYNYVAWAWDANGAGSSNTAGSITSTVSANATAGFSIATYSANNTAGATFGHGLGVAPSMVIIKKRNASERWVVYHKSISNQYIYLNETFAGETANAALRFGNDSSVVAPSSTLVTIGTSNDVNGASGTYVAYCFSEVAGYSKFGSYTGNGSSDGPFVFCGFRPKFVMFKRTDSTGDWFILDGVRETYNYVSRQLGANNSGAESGPDVYNVDFTANGFKLRNSVAAFNASGGNFIFAAFSETAFKFANAR